MRLPGLALTTALIAVVLLPLLFSISAFGAEPTKPEPAKPAAQTPAVQTPGEKPKETPLDINQQVLGKRFEQFQNTLLQMAEQMRKSDPDRAELIFRTLSKSQEDRVIGQMRTIEELLSKQKFGDSVTRQEDLAKTLYGLLELLQSENRLNEIDAERKRIEALLKDVNKLIGKEKDVRAATERGTDAERAGDQQKDVSDETKKTIDKINKQDAQKRAEKEKDSKGESKPGDSKSGDSKPGDDGKKLDDVKQPEKDKSRIQKLDKDPPKDDPKKPDDKKPGDQKSEGGEKSEGKPQDGQPMPGQPQPGKPQQGKPQDGQPMPPSDAEKQEQQTPGKQDLEQASEEMQRALEDLKKLDRNQASRHQDEAIKRLLEAKQKFEEILRQLREEEKKLALTSLEARFRKMLSLQLLVYNDTVNLAKTGQRADDAFPARAKQLARNEDEIVQEVAKALLLLREEGSSVAFPEAAEAIREDMASISQRLDRADPGELTQTIEQNVIEALEEMIDALQKELEKAKEKDKDQQDQQQQGEKDPDPLVDVIAELKMLRSLQLRINRVTKKLGRLIDGEQASEPEVIEQLQTLSRRQSKIQQATYDLSTGKNK